MAHRAREAVRIFRENGFYTVASILVFRCRKPIPWAAKFRWKTGVKAETRFWEHWFNTKGSQWADQYKNSFDPDLPLQPRVAALIPPQSEIRILDVGAGPLTFLGKIHHGKRINITAVDPLADKYDRILEKHRLHPLVRTQKLSAENLTKKFPSGNFDLVFARNSIDHAYNPERAVLQMIEVVKNGRYVLLEHTPNEAENANYSDFHQWNFSMSADGDFLIGSKFENVNMTRKYKGICTITCEMVNEGSHGDFLITRIQKR